MSPSGGIESPGVGAGGRPSSRLRFPLCPLDEEGAGDPCCRRAWHLRWPPSACDSSCWHSLGLDVEDKNQTVLAKVTLTSACRTGELGGSPGAEGRADRCPSPGREGVPSRPRGVALSRVGGPLPGEAGGPEKSQPGSGHVEAGKAAWRGCWHWAQRTRRMLRARKGDGPGLQAEGAERGAAGGCHAVLSVWAIFRVGDHEQCCLRDGGGCECQAKERALPQAQ